MPRILSTRLMILKNSLLYTAESITIFLCARLTGKLLPIISGLSPSTAKSFEKLCHTSLTNLQYGKFSGNFVT
jgi:hypothetical protein